MICTSLLLLAVSSPQTAADPLDVKTRAPVRLKDGRAPAAGPPRSLEERIALDAELSDPWHGMTEERGEPDAERAAVLSSRGSSAQTHFQLDVGHDGALWAFGGTYKASFDASGATYVPFLGSDASRNWPVHIRPAIVSIDGEPLVLDTAATPMFEGHGAVFARGPVVERYDLRVGEMEQLFVLDDASLRGEVVVRIPYETDLVATDTGDALRFDGPRGGVRATHAVAIDANDERIDVPTTLERGHVVLRVPADFVNHAAFPLTIDPVFSTMVIDGNPGVNDSSPDLAYDQTNECWAVVWEREFSATDDDIWLELFSPSGIPIQGSGRFIDLSTDSWRQPKVANNRLADQFLVVAQREVGGVQVWGRMRDAASATMGPPFRISTSLQDCRAPDVGGTSAATSQKYCVVWERYFDVGVDHDIHAKIVDVNGSVGSLIPIANTSGTYEKVPSVSPTNGIDGEGVRCWNVAWQRRFETDDWDLFGAQITPAGTIHSPAFIIDGSSRDHRWPDASSPLDPLGIDEDREWMCVFQSDEPSGAVNIRAALMRGTEVLERPHLSALLGFASMDRFQPCVDTNGSQFAVGWSERYGASTSDFDIWGASLYHAGGVVAVSEYPQLLAGSTSFEFGVDVFARRSAGLVSDWAGLVWQDNGASSSDSNIEGAVYEVPDHHGNGIGDSYCTPVPNSTGEAARIHASGSAFAGTDPFALSAYRLPQSVNAYFIGSPNAGDALPASSSGRVCLGNPLSRFNGAGQVLNSGTSGRVTLAIDTESIPQPSGGTLPITAGQTFRFQCWYRDGSTNNLTDGVAVTFE